MKWLKRRKPREFVLGTQTAAANEAEERRQLRATRESPLEGVAYDAESDEYSLFRFVDTATDARVADVALTARDLPPGDLADYRDSLTQDDLYTLLAFARRTCVRALRGDTDLLAAGWLALGIVDAERVDWRDAAVAASLLAYGSMGAGADLSALVASASEVAQPPMTAILRDHAVSGSGGISVGGYREIQTADGPALVDDYGQPYAPSLDLLAIATGVGELLERDQYRVTTITTGTDIAPVWLAAIDRDTAQTTVGRVRGCVSVSAAPASEAASVFPDQMLLAYIAECASPSDATGLATAASQPDSSNVAEIAISYETLCLIVIARSTVKGIEPIETTQSIARFREPLTQVLHGS